MTVSHDSTHPNWTLVVKFRWFDSDHDHPQQTVFSLELIALYYAAILQLDRYVFIQTTFNSQLSQILSLLTVAPPSNVSIKQ